MSATIIQFIPKADPDREERLRRRMIDAANAIYQEIFPDAAVNLLAHASKGAPPESMIYESSLGFTDTAPSEYVAPADDSA